MIFENKGYMSQENELPINIPGILNNTKEIGGINMFQRSLGKTTIKRVLFFVSLITFFIFNSLNQVVAKDPVTLKVSLLPYISYAPLFIAFEEGYFREQGLKIEFVKIRGAGQSIPALASGGIDVSTDTTG